MPKNSSRFQVSKVSDEMVFAICENFLLGKKATEIADTVNEDFKPEKKITREQIYPLISEGAVRNFIDLVPPLSKDIVDKLVKHFQLSQDKSLSVVQAPIRGAFNFVAKEAAEIVRKLVLDLTKDRQSRSEESPELHLGFGSGNTTSLFAKFLSQLLKQEKRDALPNLVLHALTPGMSSRKALQSPVASFSFFSELDADYIGLFARPITGRLRETKESPGVKSACEAASKIDIVVTSLSSSKDEHGLLNSSLEEWETAYRAGKTRESKEKAEHIKEYRDELTSEMWRGDIMFKPYSLYGPIMPQSNSEKPFSIFEINDLIKLRQKGCFVVLVVPPCSECSALRADALSPLLTSSYLDIWTHLVTDINTARELLPSNAR